MDWSYPPNSSSPSWERGTTRSVVEREALARRILARTGMKAGRGGQSPTACVSLSTLLRRVPLSQ